MGLHEVLHDREPQTGAPLIAAAGGVRPVEPLEHPRQMLARDAGAVVRDGEERATGDGSRGHGDATARIVLVSGARDEGYGCGAVAVLPKPVDLSRLNELLNETASLNFSK